MAVSFLSSCHSLHQHSNTQCSCHLSTHPSSWFSVTRSFFLATLYLRHARLFNHMPLQMSFTTSWILVPLSLLLMLVSGVSVLLHSAFPCHSPLLSLLRVFWCCPIQHCQSHCGFIDLPLQLLVSQRTTSFSAWRRLLAQWRVVRYYTCTSHRLYFKQQRYKR